MLTTSGHPVVPTESQIEDLVAAFYARIRQDTELGPIFSRIIGDDWTEHLKMMCRFWSSVMLTSGQYKGRPIPPHIKITEIEPKHFTRWLELFSKTTHDLFQEPLAEAFIDRATRIAASFKLAFAFHAKDPTIWVPNMLPMAQP